MTHTQLSVDLTAIRANYRLLAARHAAHHVAAVVKANAYGLGVEGVSRTLYDEGCREFFVATLEEGVELRGVLPQCGIGVFNGMAAGEEKEYAQHRLLPVINHAGQVALAAGLPEVIVHVDTGMTRLGLHADALEAVGGRLPIRYVMSHLACANDPADAKNAEQLRRFREALRHVPRAKASLANSAGLFLPPEFHFDMGRPGCALYGINPGNGVNPMRQVAVLSAPVIQLRTLEHAETVGYGATYAAAKGSRIAIVALGYADGWLRMLGDGGVAYIGGHKVPLAGRVSMDMLALDVSGVPESVDMRRAEFINAQQTVDDVAQACGTIGYEIFTRIGRRVKRVYG
jgi:alanine racemase